MSISLLSLLFVATAVADGIIPTAPGPQDVFIAGSNCPIQWEIDTMGIWTDFVITLMSGSNENMTVVTEVDSHLDGTDPSLTPYNWTCPEVTPYSSIYFYQFTNNKDQMNSKWTTRFTIASPSGMTTPPENLTQLDGSSVSWGTGSIQSEPANDSDALSSDDRISASPTATSTRMRKAAKPTIATLTSGAQDTAPTVILPPTPLARLNASSKSCPGMRISNSARPSSSDVSFPLFTAFLFTLNAFS